MQNIKIVSLLFLLWPSILLQANAATVESCGDSKPLAVVIVGGGPAGLAAAIVAREAGATVTVIEKRSSYTREQRVFLCDEVVWLMESWHVVCPQMKSAYVHDGVETFVVRISDLEKSLAERVNELGVKLLHGEFKGFFNESEIMIATCNGEIAISYDLLIGADGSHSSVREALNIHTNQYGEAFGIAAIIESQSPSRSADTKKLGNFFVRRVQVPPLSIVFAQNAPGALDISLTQFTQVLQDLNWTEEAQAILEGKTLHLIDNIGIVLQQASNFSDKSKRVILVGDAAATASFFEGSGAYTAIKAAPIVGVCIKNIQDSEASAYNIFDDAMQILTDELIDESLPHF